MDILLASNNKQKQKEIQDILSEYNILLPSDIGIQFAYEEEGSTFLENSFDKGKYLAYLVKNKYIVIADDSGLSINALGGIPGIYSARYGDTLTKTLTQEEKNELILANMKDEKNRDAFFSCAITLIIEPNHNYLIERKVMGKIAEDIKGENGFGYDSLFYYPPLGKRFSELSAEVKNSISHRAKAVNVVKKILNDLKQEKLSI